MMDPIYAEIPPMMLMLAGWVLHWGVQNIINPGRLLE